MNKKTLIAFLSAAALFEAQAATLYWKGPGNAATLSNWCTDAELTVAAAAVPADGDDIVLGAGAGNMTWNIDNVTPGSWTQTADYTGTVTFYTGRKNGMTTTLYGVTDDNGETRVFRVSGNCVLASGIWTHPAQPSFGKSGDAKRSTVAYKEGYGVYHIIAEIGGNMTIGAAFSANVDAKAFSTSGNDGQGPGCGSGNCSASHAGYGGRSDGTLSATYGTFRAPKTIGSSHGSIGGGCIEITVAGALSIADGATFSSIGKAYNYYCGAGGSISIVAGSISGAAYFNARGGTPTSRTYGGSGGGGRISIILTGEGSDFSNFNGTYTTQSTTGTNKASGDGCGGTIYLETAAQGVGGGTLIVDGVRQAIFSRGYNYGVIMRGDDAQFHLSKIILRDDALLIVTNATYSLEGTVVEGTTDLLSTGTNSIFRLQKCDITLTQNFSVTSDCLIFATTAGSTLRMGPQGNGTLTVTGGGRYFVEGATSLLGSLAVGSGGALSHTIGGSAENYKIDLDVSGNVTVSAGGAISATGKGYSKKQGPGRSGTTGNVPGMHAGRVYKANATVHCYGSITRPVNYGSGGGANNASDGGGAVKLTIAGSMVNNGSVEANGARTVSGYYSGCGGSVWVTANSLSGAGSFAANGGLADLDAQQAGMGSGGRVSLWLTGPGNDFSSFTGQATAFGGRKTSGSTNSTKAGAPGTVYFKTGDQAYNEGLLVISNDIASAYTTEIAANSTDGMTADVTDTDVGSVLIGANGRLEITNATLTVNGSWTNTNVFTARADSEVVFANSSIESTVKGANTFYSLVCATPGKKITFGTAAGDSTTIAANGNLTLRGEGGNPLVLRGDEANAYWYLNVPVSASMDVANVDVAYSDASGGTEIIADDSAASESQNNVNWNFVSIRPGETNTWTGAGTSAWTDSASWSLGRGPVDTDVVVIEASQNNPHLTGSIVQNVIEVRSGAALSLAGFDLTVTNLLSVAGSLACTGGEAITLLGNATLAANSFTSASSTVRITGDLAQSASLGGNRFYNLFVSKGGGSVAFDGGFDVGSKLSLEANSGDTVVTFPQGAAVTCFSFYANGETGSGSALTLSGPDWSLSVGGASVARSVKVGGSKYLVGTIVARGSSADLGNNDNWLFGGAFKTWVGGASGAFEADANWSGGSAPGPDDNVLIDAAATVTANAAISVKSLEVGGAGNASKLVVRGGADIGDSLAVCDKGTVTIDSQTTVTNSVTVYSGGTITHSANSASPTYKIDLDCGNVFFVEVGGKVDVTGMGYGVDYGISPGSSSPENHAASHGGIGCGHVNHPTTGFHASCYGSFFEPTTLGSGGYSGHSSKAGGGAVRIFSGGTMRIDGNILAEGGHGSGYYSPSGGSVYLKCARLEGYGTISANGGNVTTSCAGGGGRVALYETVATDWSEWHGKATTYGGMKITALMDGLPLGSAGSVYMQTASDGQYGGIVTFDNRGGFDYGAELPVTNSVVDAVRSYKYTRFSIGSGARLRVTGDVKVKDLSLDTTTSYLYTPYWALGIYSKLHKDRAGWRGSVSTNPSGRVYWVPEGLSLMVR